MALLILLQALQAFATVSHGMFPRPAMLRSEGFQVIRGTPSHNPRQFMAIRVLKPMVKMGSPILTNPQI